MLKRKKSIIIWPETYKAQDRSIKSEMGSASQDSKVNSNNSIRNDSNKDRCSVSKKYWLQTYQISKA